MLVTHSRHLTLYPTLEIVMVLAKLLKAGTCDRSGVKCFMKDKFRLAKPCQILLSSHVYCLVLETWCQMFGPCWYHIGQLNSQLLKTVRNSYISPHFLEGFTARDLNFGALFWSPKFKIQNSGKFGRLEHKSYAKSDDDRKLWKIPFCTSKTELPLVNSTGAFFRETWVL